MTACSLARLPLSLPSIFQNDIPVFSPALTDGSLGDMMFFHSYKNPGLVLVRCKAWGWVIPGVTCTQASCRCLTCIFPFSCFSQDIVSDLRKLVDPVLRARHTGKNEAGSIALQNLKNLTTSRTDEDYVVDDRPPTVTTPVTPFGLKSLVFALYLSPALNGPERYGNSSRAHTPQEWLLSVVDW